MKQIRHSVFETNSSSTHSVCIHRNRIEQNTMVVRDDGYIHATLGEFGWEVKDYYSQEEKLSYLLTMAAHKNGLSIDYYGNEEENQKEIDALQETEDFKHISSEVAKHAGCNGVVIDYSTGYIDHQSHEDYCSMGDFLNDYGVSILEFIFGSGVVVHTDNDNH